MEVDRKAMPGDANMLAGPHVQEKITYKAGSKVIILEFLSIEGGLMVPPFLQLKIGFEKSPLSRLR